VRTTSSYSSDSERSNHSEAKEKRAKLHFMHKRIIEQMIYSRVVITMLLEYLQYLTPLQSLIEYSASCQCNQLLLLVQFFLVILDTWNCAASMSKRVGRNRRSAIDELQGLLFMKDNAAGRICQDRERIHPCQSLRDAAGRRVRPRATNDV
jgi:hypothetical protein